MVLEQAFKTNNLGEVIWIVKEPCGLGKIGSTNIEDSRPLTNPHPHWVVLGCKEGEGLGFRSTGW